MKLKINYLILLLSILSRNKVNFELSWRYLWNIIIFNIFFGIFWKKFVFIWIYLNLLIYIYYNIIINIKLKKINKNIYGKANSQNLKIESLIVPIRFDSKLRFWWIHMNPLNPKIESNLSNRIQSNPLKWKHQLDTLS